MEEEAPHLAASIKDLDWVRDGIDGRESMVVQDLLYIAAVNHIAASYVVSNNWVRDGVEGAEAEAIDRISNIDSAEVASSVVSLGWVLDGIDDTEPEAIEILSYIANEDIGLGLPLVSMRWVRDGIEDAEAEAIDWIRNLGSTEVASAIVSLGWMQDGIDATESKVIESLHSIAYYDVAIASAVVSLGWVQDGIDATESGAIENLYSIVYNDADVASVVVSLVWVQDGIKDVEADAIASISNIENTGIASALVSKDWVQEGIDRVESQAIEEISYLAYEDAGAALGVVSMPFLETVEPPDVSAVTSLRWLATYEPEAFENVMSHAALQDGISDDWAHVVATLYGVATRNPGLIDVLLDLDRITLYWRTISLPLSGDVVLSIIRTGPGVTRSMDLLEHSVRSAEEYMGARLPTNHIGLLYENAVSSTAAGQNFGTHMAILPDYDTPEETDDTGFSGFLIAHEVAHYYWSGNSEWVDEGAAEFMASAIESVRTGRPIEATNSPCVYADNIAQLESLDITRDDSAFGCNYSLGERLFLDINRTLGDARSREGFRQLYLASEVEDDTDGYAGTSLGIEQVREAFGTEDGAVDTVIARWYDGTEPYDLSHRDTSPVESRLPAINGSIDDAYITTTVRGPAVSSFSAQDITGRAYLTLKYSYSVLGGPHEVDLEIVDYYYDDGFVFNRRIRKLTAEEQYIGGTSWSWIGSPAGKWRPGHYRVYVYAGERKVAEVAYEVTP